MYDNSIVLVVKGWLSEKRVGTSLLRFDVVRASPNSVDTENILNLVQRLPVLRVPPSVNLSF